MGSLLSQADLARLRKVSPAAVSKAVKMGRLITESGGEIDLSRPENAAYLMGGGAPGRPKGSRSRKPRPTRRQVTAPDVAEGDGDELPPDAFVAPTSSGPVYLGRVLSQRKRVIAAIRLFEDKVIELKRRFCPMEWFAKLLEYGIGTYASLPDVAGRVDWQAEDIPAAIDAAVDAFVASNRDVPVSVIPAHSEKAEDAGHDDGLEALSLDDLRGRYDELHALRHEILLAERKREILPWDEVEQRFAAIGGEVSANVYTMGRRLGPRLEAMARTAGPDAATQALREELERAAERFQRFKLTPTG